MRHAHHQLGWRAAGWVARIAGAVLLTACNARARAVYQANVDATLQVRSIADPDMNELTAIPEGLLIEAAGAPFPPFEFEQGNADAGTAPRGGPLGAIGPPNEDGFSPIGLNGGISFTVQSDGFAERVTIPSIAESLGRASGAVSMLNDTEQTYMIRMQESWNYFLNTSIDQPDDESARAHVSIRLYAEFSASPISLPLLLEYPTIEKHIMGTDSATLSGEPQFLLTFRPGNAITFLMFVQSDGKARDVPEPGIEALLLGWVGLLVRRRSRCDSQRESELRLQTS